MFDAKIEKSNGALTLAMKSPVIAEIVRTAARSRSTQWSLYGSVARPDVEGSAWASEIPLHRTDALIRLILAAGAQNCEDFQYNNTPGWSVFCSPWLETGIVYRIEQPMSSSGVKTFAANLRDVARSIIENSRPISIRVRLEKAAPAPSPPSVPER